MPITTPLSTLKSATQGVSSLAKADSFNPATAMAFLSHHAGTLSIKATDMNDWLAMAVPADGDGVDAIQVDAAKLTDLVGKLSGDTIKIEVSGGYLHLSAGRSKRKLAGVVTPYPEMTGIAGAAYVEADTAVLRKAIEFCAPSISDDSRPVYAGVKLQDGIAVSYNGAGLSAAPHNLKLPSLTIAPGTMKLLKWVNTETVSIATTGRTLSIKWDGGEITSKVIDGEWSFLAKGLDAVMPEHDTHLSVMPSEMMRAVNAVATVAASDLASKSKVVTLSLSRDECSVSVSSQAGDGVEPFDAAWDGDDISINLSSARLRQILSGFAQEKDVTIGIAPLGDKPKGCVFRQQDMPGYLGMLMQIR